MTRDWENIPAYSRTLSIPTRDGPRSIHVLADGHSHRVDFIDADDEGAREQRFDQRIVSDGVPPGSEEHIGRILQFANSHDDFVISEGMPDDFSEALWRLKTALDPFAAVAHETASVEDTGDDVDNDVPVEWECDYVILSPFWDADNNAPELLPLREAVEREILKLFWAQANQWLSRPCVPLTRAS